MKILGPKPVICLIAAFGISYSIAIQAQAVRIGVDNGLPHPSAILELSADSLGLLLPRTTTESITDPVHGLLIYDTVAQVIQLYDGSSWQSLGQLLGTFFYADRDGDSEGDKFAAVYAPTQPSGYVLNADDCDDTDASISTGAVEVCDGLDNDCDELVDQDDPDVVGSTTYYMDTDGDGYGDAGQDSVACSQPTGYVLDSTDCDDGDSSINPDSYETCSGVDDNCNGLIDAEDLESFESIDDIIWLYDADEDGYPNDIDIVYSCDSPGENYYLLSGYFEPFDCDDSDPAISPEAIEVCDDGVDNDCDGDIDENDSDCN